VGSMLTSMLSRPRRVSSNVSSHYTFLLDIKVALRGVATIQPPGHSRQSTTEGSASHLRRRRQLLDRQPQVVAHWRHAAGQPERRPAALLVGGVVHVRELHGNSTD